MDVEVDLGLDSFVDIIANTVGMVIILVIFTSTMSRTEEEKGNTELANFREMNKEIERIKARHGSLEKLGRKIQTAKGALGQKEKRRDKLRGMLKDDLNAYAKIQQDTRDTNQDILDKRSLLENLTQKSAGLDGTIDQLKKDAREKLGVDQKALDEYRQRTLDFLIDKRKEKEREKEALQKKDIQKELAELEKQKSQLRTRIAEINRDIGQLKEPQLITVRDPLVPPDRLGRPIWIECYVPENSVDDDDLIRGCVRLVNKTNYEKKGHIVEPKPDRVGESHKQIQATTSDYQTFLSDQQGKQDKHHLYFVVRTNAKAFRVFREARQLAWTAGWRVNWYPLDDKKTSIPIGPAPRARRSSILN